MQRSVAQRVIFAIQFGNFDQRYVFNLCNSLVNVFNLDLIVYRSEIEGV